LSWVQDTWAKLVEEGQDYLFREWGEFDYPIPKEPLDREAWDYLIRKIQEVTNSS
jgi:hypothetical protein